ncbi:hypothetical protein PENSPDRAFT_648545 [Peniophora sp. CONT]|nr:hypothetical protein PENSPDRAFT_648545 [Peniophora sp. CONT]
MKKAYELSTLTGTQVLLLVVSETGLVYTFTTAKLQPLVTQPEGKNLIQACLNAPHGQLPSSGLPTPSPSSVGGGSRMGAPSHSNVPGGLSIGSGAKEEDDESERPGKRRRRSSTSGSVRPRSPQSPSNGLPQPLAIPGGASVPQMGMGTPTGAPPTQSPAQPGPPASPHYQHSSPGYPPASAPPPGDVYGQPMMHAQSAYYPPPPPPAGAQWPGAVQGGQPHYGGRR